MSALPVAAVPEPGRRMLLASSVLAAVGVVMLTAMFVSFAVGATSAALTFGRVNDVLVMTSYALAVPGVAAVATLLRPRFPVATRILFAVGITAIGAIVVLQALLVAGSLTFEQEVVPVSIALLVLGGWFVATGYLGSRAGVLPRGTRMGLLAATYVGYPIWALWLAGRLRPDADVVP